MKLSNPFIRLPLRFNVVRLKLELSQFTEEDWAKHPLNYKGNSAIRLISANGEENDDVVGEMMATRHLKRCEYIQQIFSSFGSVLTRSRLMRLAPGEVVPAHCDINYHWISKTRIHIPIVTHPDVNFNCDDNNVHMAEGEAWIFDNWRRHSVVNNSPYTRVHLVLDTSGSTYFWDLVSKGQSTNFDQISPSTFVPYVPGASSSIVTERFGTPKLMSKSEVSWLSQNILADLDEKSLEPELSTVRQAFCQLVIGFVRDWEALWGIYGEEGIGAPRFRSLVAHAAQYLSALPDQLVLSSNGQSAKRIFELHVLRVAVAEKFAVTKTTDPLIVKGKVRDFFDRPIFIVAAPRSGSTLLFETLACSSQLFTIGGESHAIFESLPNLRPVAPGGSESNRLTAREATPETIQSIRAGFAAALKDRESIALQIGDVDRIRMLDKLPKNSLRIPFLKRVFPDALFVFLFRDPRQSISSMIEAWESGQWVTYPNISAGQKRWSLLLPPGWPAMLDAPLEAICAHQWTAANNYILSDLEDVEPDRQLRISYDALCNTPSSVIEQICAFANLKYDRYLRERVSESLPLSRYTKTPPNDLKWKRHKDEISSVQNIFENTWKKLQK